MQSVTERRRTRGQGGFTLIELLVVIAILGVLAGVVVFAVGGIQDNSDKTACEIDARTVKTAVQAFRAQERRYPTSAADTTADPDGAGPLTGEPFIGGFLDEASDNVIINYDAGGAEPTYDWDGKCDSVAGLPAQP